MENRKKSGSSFTADLFGVKESSASISSGVLSSIFPPSTKVKEREFLSLDSTKKNQDLTYQAWNNKSGTPDYNPQSRVDGETASYYEEQKVEPCHLSSSIYYGGQDLYSRPSGSQTSECTTFNKDGGVDDSGSASRGNWWQGSLYY